MPRRVAACLMGLAFAGIGHSAAAAGEMTSRGAALYMEHCSNCHGSEGDGRGPLSIYYTPRPRNFQLGSFKLRSTDIGDYPSAQDVMVTITHGIEGSYGASMPAFDHLPDRDRWALVEVVRVLAEIPEFPDPMPVPPHPGRADPDRGAALFAEHTCSGCHGVTGDGQGELAGELTDSEGHHIQPADLTSGQFKGGSTPEDLWRRIYTGLEGTPMPSFGINLSDTEIWALVDYVQTLQAD